MIAGILFDLDGVLVQTDTLHFLAWKALADRLGIPFDQVQGERCRGVSRMASLEYVLERADRTFSQDEKEALAQEKNKVYRAQLAALSPDAVSQEVRNTLALLRARGYRLALASGSKNAGLILSRTGLGAYLDAVTDGNDITRSKPHPEIFQIAAKRLSLPPSACAVVDDALAGIQAGRAAGMTVLGIGASAQAGVGDYNLARFSQLLDIFPCRESATQ